LTQVDASIILNITGRTDLKTIEDYLDNSGKTKKEIDELIGKIMKFEKGEFLFALQNFCLYLIQALKLVRLIQM
jgi:hypothetical protein